MLALSRLNYYRRIFSAYLTPQKSHLTFWHETPEINDHFRPGVLGEYYMPFSAKADYSGEYDREGVPLLNYHGKIGLQYNPIAIAQYGLANHRSFSRTGDLERRRKFLAAADWLVTNLEKNAQGMCVWNHHFDWEYRTLLKAPWRSALAQGQGISILVRAYHHSKNPLYMETAKLAFEPFLMTIDKGGVSYIDERGDTWFEEYVVFPPTHILNGFIWASWGVYDYFVATAESAAERLFRQAIQTLSANIHRYDAGFWSLYEQSGTKLKMLASPFYHHLHIVQLKILHQLTGEEIFRRYAEKWEGYRRNRLYQKFSLFHKGIFKLLYY